MNRVFFIAGLLFFACGFAIADETAVATHILEMSNRKAGICSMPRIGDGKLAVAIARNSKLIVHALSDDAGQLAAARALADEAGIMGRTLYIEQGVTGKIPLADRYADLVVVVDTADADLAALPAKEIRRICAAYRGVAIIGRAKDLGPGLTKAKLADWAKGLDVLDVKIVEDEMGLWAVARMPPLQGGDEWTHFWHDAGNNPVSTDTAFTTHDVSVLPLAADAPHFIREGKGQNFTLDAAKIDTSAPGVAPKAIYQTLRMGNSPMTYTVHGLKVGADYTVRLHFVEPWEKEAGKRVMDVTANGQPALTKFDIIAESGQNKAVVRQVKVCADAQGQIAIRFTCANNGVVLSAIEIQDGNTPVLKIQAGGKGSAKDGFLSDVDVAAELPAPQVLIQYVSPPKVGAGGSARVAGGRMFEAQGQEYKFGKGLEGWLWCRDASNGQILWEMKLPRVIEAKQAGVFVATAQALYLIDEDRPGVQVIDAETGKQTRVIGFKDVTGQCKWMAVENGILYALFGEPAPPFRDNATYHGDSSVKLKIVENKLRHGKSMCAYDLAKDQLLWTHTETPNNLIDCRSVGVWNDRICFFSENAEYEKMDKPWGDEPVVGTQLLCLDGRTGKVLWENKDEVLHNLVRQYTYIFGREWTPTLICSPDGIRLRLIGIYKNDLLCFDPETGKLRWKMDKADKATPTTFGGFFKDGQYWQSGGAWDALTGKLLKMNIPWDGGCGTRTASPAGIFGNYNADTIGMDVKSDCHMGSFVAEGLLNVARGWCNCEGIWRGTFAFASRGDLDVNAPAGPDRLSRDPNPPTANAAMTITAQDWPMYRHDCDRSAASPVTVPDNAKVLWHYQLATPYVFSSDHDLYSPHRQDQPTEPVTAADSIYFGGSDGKIECLDAASGMTRWRFWTGGQVYAAPSLWHGRAYAGSMDGDVYCLDADTGRLVWRFRCSPVDQRIMVADHLVSRWPVQGGVLVQPSPSGEPGKGVVYATSGMVNVLGAQVYALDADTGQMIWQNTTAGTKDDGKFGITPSGFMTIIGDKLFVRNRFTLPGVFDLKTGEQIGRPLYFNARWSENSYRYGPAGREIAVLGDGWVLEGGRLFQHELNQREGDRGYESFDLKLYGKDGLPERRARIKITDFSIIPPAFDGELMAFVEGGRSRAGKDAGSPRPYGTLGLMAFDKKKMLETAKAVADTTIDYQDKKNPLCALLAINGEKAVTEEMRVQTILKGTPSFRWEYKDPFVQVNAVALAKNAVLITYGVQKHGTMGLLDDYSAWKVAALDRGDGHSFWECDLPCEPVLCSLAIDRAGRILVTLRDGGVICIGTEK